MERVTMEEHSAPPRRLRARWLGRMAYRDAWAIQQALAAARADGSLREDQLLLVEHDAVLTLGRNASEAHILALPAMLEGRGIEVLRVERGGEVTYHGPGQLVAYPIVAIATPGAAAATAGSAVPTAGAAAPTAGTAPTAGAAHPTAGVAHPTGGAAAATAGPAARPLGVRRFVEALEGAMADTCAQSGVSAGPRPGHPGCWVGADTPFPRKIGAIGIRVARGVSFHGIALNVTTNLADFDLIDPCGMPGLRSTSVARERARAERAAPATQAAGSPRAGKTGYLADPPPSTASVADPPPSTASVAEAAAAFARALAARLGMRLVGPLPPAAHPADERRELDAITGTRAGPR